MNLMYHLVPKGYFEALDAIADYVPAAFARDGFIHCTDEAEEMARVANLWYAAEPGPHLYLCIEKDRVHAPILYEDDAKKYPHVYGALNRDAIAAVRVARRDAAGNFLPPDAELNRSEQ